MSTHLFKYILITAIIVLSHITPKAENGHFTIIPVKNPEYHGNELFRAYDSYYNPRIKQLRERYGLDQVVAGETDEWRRILRLRHWIKSKIRIENDHPTPTRGDAFAILDAALQGGGFHCAHFSIVQEAVLNSYGYVARRLGCGPGTIEKGGHHGVNEVWVNSFGKWVLIDAKYDVHFEKDHLPLSALEIRDEVWKDGGKSVLPCFGLNGEHDTDQYSGDYGPTAETYRWCSWENTTNRFTSFPAAGNSVLFMLDDEFFRQNVWHRDGKPHWAYNTPYLITTTRRDWIEWTPNVIHSTVEIKDNCASASLSSFTPNFRNYQMSRPDGSWADCGEQLTLPLEKGKNQFSFRTENLFGVAGPVHRIEIAWEMNE
ncbi:MAG: transglutaminase domain-containing protein [Candidatus Omnitrophota bacterium]